MSKPPKLTQNWMSKLVSLLNMLASDNDGERANAARMIARMAAADNKTVSDFVMTGGPPRTVYVDRVVEKTVYKDRPAPPKPPGEGRPGRDILDNLKYAATFPEHLSGWDLEFISSVLFSCWDDDDLTSKQEKAARRIIHKVRIGEGDEEPLV